MQIEKKEIKEKERKKRMGKIWEEKCFFKYELKKWEDNG